MRSEMKMEKEGVSEGGEEGHFYKCQKRSEVKKVMPQNFLDLHIVDFCQLDCKHCYLNKGNRVMPLDMLRTICEDFLSTNFTQPRSDIILSGGEPLLHPKFVETFTRRLVLRSRYSSC